MPMFTKVNENYSSHIYVYETHGTDETRNKHINLFLTFRINTKQTIRKCKDTNLCPVKNLPIKINGDYRFVTLKNLSQQMFSFSELGSSVSFISLTLNKYLSLNVKVQARHDSMITNQNTKSIRLQSNLQRPRETLRN